MTDQRKLEIATGVVRYMLRKQGVSLKPEGKRELGNAAKAIGVPVEELREFIRPFVQEMMDETFGK